jgi:dienelactone hydrolase
MYGAIQERDLTGPDQYTHQRSGSGPLCEYLGRFPQLPTDPDPDIVDEWEFEDFVLRKLEYAVEPKLRVEAYLLVPDGVDKATPAPGVLALHEHNDEYLAGKSETVGLVEDPEYTYLRAVHPDPSHEPPDAKRQFAYGRDLVKRGYVVLAPDFLSFETYRDSGSQDDPDYYDIPETQFLRGFEQMVSQKYLLYGSTLAAKHLHDVVVAVSVLTGLREVAGQGIGVIGHSQGGPFASLLAAFDDRIEAGVSSCGTFSYDRYEWSNRMETADTILPGFRADGYDFDYLLDAIPPTPFLATYGSEEMNNGEEFLETDRNQFTAIRFEGGHGFPTAVRERAYDFLEAHVDASPEKPK